VLERAREVGNPFWGQQGGVAHRSSAFHGGTDQSAGNDDEGCLSVVGVDDSWFGKEVRAQADVGVVIVGAGRCLRRLVSVTPSRWMQPDGSR
jgi:hypothetical protein